MIRFIFVNSIKIYQILQGLCKRLGTTVYIIGIDFTH